jgi:hypothetical protein
MVGLGPLHSLFWGSAPGPAPFCFGAPPQAPRLFVLGLRPRPRAPLSRLFFFAWEATKKSSGGAALHYAR